MGPGLSVHIGISRLHHPVTALGPGRRAGIWLQGCSIRCHGCVSVDTWDADPSSQVPVADVLSWLDGLPAAEVDGVTISGGEPTDQPAALAELLEGIARWRDRRPDDLPTPDVLVFSGRPPAWLDTPAAACLTHADAVMAGPFVASRTGGSPLRGSENQRLVLRTELGRRRTADYERCARTAMQVQVTEGEVWMIGIPLPGTMDAFAEATAERGVTWSVQSWRS
jgi:anaerobic ribonucleoside-triphosphate reductase activating protein